MMIPAFAPAQSQTACRAQIWQQARSVVGELATLQAELPPELYTSAVEDFALKLEPLLPEMNSQLSEEVVSFVENLRDTIDAQPAQVLKLSNSLSGLLQASPNLPFTGKILEALLLSFRSQDRAYPSDLDLSLKTLQSAAQRCRL